MSLHDTRISFLRQSGRYDLVTAPVAPAVIYVDNGADNFIRAGQRYLDRHHVYEEATERQLIDFAIGDFSFDIARVRSIKKIWTHISNVRTELLQTTYEWLGARFADHTAIENGVPVFYCIDKAVSSGETRIYVMPPADTAGQLEIEGLFYASELVENTDENYWTRLWPNVLVMAALRELEVFYRNTQGVKDWENAIQFEMDAFQRDLVERDLVDSNQMRG